MREQSAEETSSKQTVLKVEPTRKPKRSIASRDQKRCVCVCVCFDVSALWGLRFGFRVRIKISSTWALTSNARQACASECVCVSLPTLTSTSVNHSVCWFFFFSPFPVRLLTLWAMLTWPLLTLALCFSKLILLIRAVSRLCDNAAGTSELEYKRCLSFPHWTWHGFCTAGYGRSQQCCEVSRWYIWSLRQLQSSLMSRNTQKSFGTAIKITQN